MENDLPDYSSLFKRGCHIQILWKNQSINLQKVGVTRQKMKYVCLSFTAFVFPKYFFRYAKSLKLLLWSKLFIGYFAPIRHVLLSSFITFAIRQFCNFEILENYFMFNVRLWFFLRTTHPEIKVLKIGINFSGEPYHNHIWPEKVPSDFHLLFEWQYLILRYFERRGILLW